MKERLKETLENVSDTYEDFVTGVMLLCKTDESRKAVVEYITNNRNVTTSEVLDYCVDVLKI
ncbi:MAG: hypothetical protein LUG91_10225 [Ruminococcus sp.]|nr:hypothetical protein [Ruminococcus sp.]